MKIQLSRALLATLGLFSAPIQAGSDGKCRALVLSGGANHGAWEAGVIWGLVHYGDAADFTWDVVSGVSAGAINTAGIATWAPGTEVEMTEWLSDEWAGLTNKDVWTVQPGGPMTWLFEEPSILDDAPALETLGEIISHKGEIARRFAVSAVDVQSGDYITMTQENTPFENLAQSALSSGSIPGVFPPQHLNGYVFMDGGTVWNVNIDSAIQQCLELVEDESDIILDVAICDYASTPTGKESNNALRQYAWARNARTYYTGMDATSEELKAYPGIDVRYYFQEHDSCDDNGLLDFRNETTWCMQEAGRNDAKAMLEIGSDNIKATMDAWQGDISLRKAFPYFGDYLKKIYSSVFE